MTSLEKRVQLLEDAVLALRGEVEALKKPSSAIESVQAFVEISSDAPCIFCDGGVENIVHPRACDAFDPGLNGVVCANCSHLKKCHAFKIGG